MNSATAFFLAARPKTLSASLAPVFLGAFLAAKETPLNIFLFLLTLFFALLIQIGTNFANDYFDFMKGADTSERIGPKRAVQQGWIAPKTMWQATLITFAGAMVVAIPLIARAGLWSLGLGGLCVLFGILYTGGPKPLGYLGFGEGLVLIFFGPVACMGTFFLQTGFVSLNIFLASLSPGLISAAILTANNLRDAVTDAQAGKKTVVVRFGTPLGRWLFALFLLLAAVFSIPFSSFLPFVFLTAPFRDLLESHFAALLPKTSRLLLFYTIAFIFLA